MGWRLLHGDESVEDDQLDVVVRLLHDQVDVGGGRRLDRGRSGGEGDQGARGLVPHRRALAVEEVVDAADEAGALVGVGEAHLVNQLHDDELQNVSKVAHLRIIVTLQT